MPCPGVDKIRATLSRLFVSAWLSSTRRVISSQPFPSGFGGEPPDPLCIAVLQFACEPFRVNGDVVIVVLL